MNFRYKLLQQESLVFIGEHYENAVRDTSKTHEGIFDIEENMFEVEQLKMEINLLHDEEERLDCVNAFAK